MTEQDERKDITVIEVERKEFYTSKEIAELFGVSTSRIRQLRDKLGINGVKFGNTRLHTLEDVQRMAQDRNSRIVALDIR